MGKKQEIAIGIALQSKVLCTCPIHNQLFCDDETFMDDENMGRAFALAVELVRDGGPYAEEFHHDPHALADLLSFTIAATPTCCPDCKAQRFAMTGQRPASASLSLA